MILGRLADDSRFTEIIAKISYSERDIIVL